MTYYQGDPGWGAIARVVGRPAVRGVAKVGGKLLRKVLGSRKARKVATVAGAGAVFEAGGRVVRGPARAEGEPRRYKRMNVTNVKALRRAIRRTKGFAKLARSVITITSPRPARGKITFKSRKRR